jgi:uncharacterized protein (DUF3084 family)
MAQFMEQPKPTLPDEEGYSPSRLSGSREYLPHTIIRDLDFVKRRYAVIIGEIRDIKEEVKRLYSTAQDKSTSARRLAARVERMETATKRYSILVEEEARREAVQLVTESRRVCRDRLDNLISQAQEEIEKGKQELKQLVAARQILERVREQTDSAPGRFVPMSMGPDPTYGAQNG